METEGRKFERFFGRCLILQGDEIIADKVYTSGENDLTRTTKNSKLH